MNESQNKKYPRLAGISLLALTLASCTTTAPTPPPPSFFAPRGPEQVFRTPDQAATALADANRHNDKAALLKILGPHAAKLISSGDAIADKEGRVRFAKAYDSAHKFENSDDTKETLVVGPEEWPLPIPLIRVATDGWQFDTEAGAQEILNRRIGRNELDVIKTARTYVEAQREFAAQHRLPDGQNEYAQRFISTPGRHDGLYWPAKAGEEPSPFGPLIAHAQAEGYAAGKKKLHPQPYHGYYYKILAQQGPHAAGGGADYIANGHMVNGFALIVFPAQYGDSGMMTFIVNQNGIVFEKNLGPDTANLAMRITAYDPDESWKIAAN